MNLTKTNKLILAAFAFVAVFALGGGRAHAATLTVGSGCTIANAIDSVNAGSDQASCGGSSYGTNDTINIPAGTQTLTADLPTITEPVVIQGAGMGSTIVSGDNGQYQVFSSSVTDLTIKDLKITAFAQSAFDGSVDTFNIENVEVDGTDSSAPNGGLTGLNIKANNVGGNTFNINNVYIHDLVASASGAVQAIQVGSSAGGRNTTVSISNTTISGLHNTSSTTGALNTILFGVGTQGLSSGTAEINATVQNITIDNIVSDGASYNTFGIAGFALSQGGDSEVNITAQNVTVTGIRGQVGSYGDTAAFSAAGAGFTSGDEARVNINVGNSLSADNLSNSLPSNCASADLTSTLSGSGSSTETITSLGHNISDDSSCTSFNQTGDQQNINDILSTLGPLQNNGGSVPTRALLAGSPAISAGSHVLGVSTDARGVARPSSNPSVGAYQYVAGASTSTPAAGGGTAAPNTGVGSVSILAVVVASLFGTIALGYSIVAKRY